MPSRRLPIYPGLCLIGLLLWGLGAPAAMIVFKDGFVLYGQVSQRKEWVVDSGGGRPPRSVPIVAGTYILNADARHILFSHAQVEDVQQKDEIEGGDFIQFINRVHRSPTASMHPLTRVIGATPWTNQWQRIFKSQAASPRNQIKQALTVLTPSYARVDALKYHWTAYYLTREWQPSEVRDLLLSHPDMKMTGQEEADAVKRFRVFRFFVQAGWYEEADYELNKILKDLPGQKDKVEEFRNNLIKLRALKTFDDIERAYQAGRHRWVQEQLGKFPRQGLDDKILARIRTFKTEYETANERLENARRLLPALAKRVPSPQGQPFKDAVAAILEELTYDNVVRLETFLSLAPQAERDDKAGKKPENEPGQLLALAVTGWLLGKDSAENKVDAALNLWKARQFVLKYLQTPKDREREQLLQDGQSRKAEIVALDEMTQLIGFLPPAAPAANTSTEPQALRSELPWGRKQGIAYLVQMPPEYHPGRSYPVLVALHHGAEQPRAMLDRLGKQAGEHGYILVAPSWQRGTASAYGFSADEHAAVLEVLRDLGRRFSLDNDRVFFTGLGEGGTMAFDVGLSHPDLFAGVLPVNGRPRFFIERYLVNAQYLPLYVVDGELASPNLAENENMFIFQKFVPLGYPALYIQYGGRGLEWFEGEVPLMFDWMDRKRDRTRRASGFPELGKQGGSVNQDFQTMRQTDNHFYWLSTDAIRDANVNDYPDWKGSKYAATLRGRIGEGNQINIVVRSLKQLSVWLGRDMIDFGKPVTIRVNGSICGGTRKLQPSLGTLLEDFYLRGDRKRLFWARFDIDRF